METAAPNASPPRTRSLKLTISFIAFLAVLPLLVGVAYRNFKESDEKEQERVWLVSRSNAAAMVADWFYEAYRIAQVNSHSARLGADTAPPLKDSALSAALAAEFPGHAAKLGLSDAALYWNSATKKDPLVQMVARVGDIEGAPDDDVLGVFQSGMPRENERIGSGTTTHSVAVEAILPLTYGGQVRGVVRLILSSETWASRGQACASSLSTWFEETRSRLIAQGIAQGIAQKMREALNAPLRDHELLKKDLDASVERLRESLHINGLAVFHLGEVLIELANRLKTRRREQADHVIAPAAHFRQRIRSGNRHCQDKLVRSLGADHF